MLLKPRNAAAVFVFLLAVTACSKTDPLYCDESTTCVAGHEACDVGGLCPAAEFIKNTCIPAEDVCWDGGAGATDGAPSSDAIAVDAGAVDAIPQIRWDVAYGNHYYLAGASTLTSGFVRIANNGDTVLDLDTLELIAVTHDAPTPATVDIFTSPTIRVLEIGQAGGHLGSNAHELIVDSGLMLEPNVDGNSNYFAMQISDLPQQWAAFTVDAVVHIQGKVATLSIEVEPSITGATAFDTAERLSSASP